MIATEHLELLRSAVGDEGLLEHGPIDIDGVAPSVSLRPADGASLAATLATVGQCGLSVLVRGGGNRLGLGNPPTAGDAILSTERMDSIVDFDPSEGVCRLAAGARLRDAQAQIRDHGRWELPLDPPGETATLGGCIAAAAHGPRAQGYGTPRAVLLGLEVCLASGERTQCGGRVVKNVTGYDLNKLYTGSHGTLGVIESAWLRLKPRPDHAEIHTRGIEDLDRACRIAIEASRRSTARVAALIAPAAERGAGNRVVVEWAGDSTSVAADAAWFSGCAGHGEPNLTAVDEVRDLQGGFGVRGVGGVGGVGGVERVGRVGRVEGGGGLRFRIGALPTKLAASIAALRQAGASSLTYPGVCQIYAGFELDSNAPDSAVGNIFQTVDRVAREASGDFVCEAAPTRAKTGRDVFGTRGELLPIYRNLKVRFDPGSILNPGRFAGGI